MHLLAQGTISTSMPSAHIPLQFFFTPLSCMAIKYQKTIIRMMLTRSEHFKSPCNAQASFLKQGICLRSVTGVINTLVTIPSFIFRLVIYTRGSDTSLKASLYHKGVGCLARWWGGGSEKRALTWTFSSIKAQLKRFNRYGEVCQIIELKEERQECRQRGVFLRTAQGRLKATQIPHPQL